MCIESSKERANKFKELEDYQLQKVVICCQPNSPPPPTNVHGPNLSTQRSSVFLGGGQGGGELGVN